MADIFGEALSPVAAGTAGSSTVVDTSYKASALASGVKAFATAFEGYGERAKAAQIAADDARKLENERVIGERVTEIKSKYETAFSQGAITETEKDARINFEASKAITAFQAKNPNAAGDIQELANSLLGGNTLSRALEAKEETRKNAREDALRDEARREKEIDDNYQAAAKFGMPPVYSSNGMIDKAATARKMADLNTAMASAKGAIDTWNQLKEQGGEASVVLKNNAKSAIDIGLISTTQAIFEKAVADNVVTAEELVDFDKGVLKSLNDFGVPSELQPVVSAKIQAMFPVKGYAAQFEGNRKGLLEAMKTNNEMAELMIKQGIREASPWLATVSQMGNTGVEILKRNFEKSDIEFAKVAAAAAKVGKAYTEETPFGEDTQTVYSATQKNVNNPDVTPDAKVKSMAAFANNSDIKTAAPDLQNLSPAAFEANIKNLTATADLITGNAAMSAFVKASPAAQEKFVANAAPKLIAAAHADFTSAIANGASIKYLNGSIVQSTEAEKAQIAEAAKSGPLAKLFTKAAQGLEGFRTGSENDKTVARLNKNLAAMQTMGISEQDIQAVLGFSASSVGSKLDTTPEKTVSVVDNYLAKVLSPEQQARRKTDADYNAKVLQYAKANAAGDAAAEGVKDFVLGVGEVTEELASLPVEAAKKAWTNLVAAHSVVTGVPKIAAEKQLENLKLGAEVLGPDSAPAKELQAIAQRARDADKMEEAVVAGAKQAVATGKEAGANVAKFVKAAFAEPVKQPRQEWIDAVPADTRDTLRGGDGRNLIGQMRYAAEDVMSEAGKVYGTREDGTAKGSGWLGEIPVKGTTNVATEKSISVEIDGAEVLIPAIVPGLTKEELDAVVNKPMSDWPKTVIAKATAHAIKRMKQGASPFKN